MKLNDEQLKEVTQFAELLFTPAEVATVVGVSVPEFISDMEMEEEPSTLAYNKGRLLAKASIRKKLFTLANQGSSQAQSLIIKMEQDSEQQKLRELYDRA